MNVKRRGWWNNDGIREKISEKLNIKVVKTEDEDTEEPYIILTDEALEDEWQNTIEVEWWAYEDFIHYDLGLDKKFAYHRGRSGGYVGLSCEVCHWESNNEVIENKIREILQDDWYRERIEPSEEDLDDFIYDYYQYFLNNILYSNNELDCSFLRTSKKTKENLLKIKKHIEGIIKWLEDPDEVANYLIEKNDFYKELYPLSAKKSI
jgi:hypothetical protein